MKDYDETVSFLGQWGRFQQLVFFLLCACIVPSGFGAFALVFLADVPSHRCLVPEVNLTEAWQQAIIPVEVVNGREERSSCSRYRLDVVRNLSAQGFAPGRDVNLTDLQQEECVDGWSYSEDIYQSTIVSEFDLVCTEQWKQPFTSMIFFIGFLIGSFFSGQLSDRFGRKPVLLATMILHTTFTLAESFSPSWTVLTIFIFLRGFGQMSTYVTTFVLGAEIFTGGVRLVFSSMGVCLSFALGYMLLPLVAYFLRGWRSLLLAHTVLGLLYFTVWWFVPESPRWLLSQGRVEEAEAVVRNAAKRNKVEAPQFIFEDHKLLKEAPSEEHHTILDLLRYRNIRITSLILCLVWFSLSTTYFALSLNSSRLHANPYLSCFISAAVEVPAYISSWLALRYFPRRLTVISILVFGGALIFFIPLVPQSLSDLSVAMEITGKYGITTGMSLIYAYSAELYPTVLRNTATGTFATAARTGSSVSPFVLQLSAYFHSLPYITLGTLAVVSAFTSVFLPESFRRPLPQTLDEMHQRESVSCPFIKRKRRSTSVVLSETQL